MARSTPQVFRLPACAAIFIVLVGSFTRLGAAASGENVLGTAKAEAALSFDPFAAAAKPSTAAASYILVPVLGVPATTSLPVSGLNPNQVNFSINDVTVQLPAAGGTTATFNVTLSGPCNQQLTIGYKTADETAKAGIDYVAKTGTLTFPIGTTNVPITITVLNAAPSKPVSFTVTLSGQSGGSGLSRATGTGTINPQSIPVPPFLTLFGASTNEGVINHVIFVKVTLSAPQKQAVTFNFNTSGGSQNPQAEPHGVDYNGYSSTAFTFAPGQTVVSIPITITGASKLPRKTAKPAKGSFEYFEILVTSVKNNVATIKTGQATVTILWDK